MPRKRPRGLTPWRPRAASAELVRKAKHVLDEYEAFLAARAEVDRQQGQQQYLEVWVEAAGMASLAWDVTERYSVPVYSSGGFDSLTSKYDAARRIRDRELPTVVLHVGDYDESGEAMYDNVADDIPALVRDLGGLHVPEFVRAAVTRDQIDFYDLPTKPKKEKKVKTYAAFTDTVTVQAEAFAPDVLQQLIREAVEDHLDLSLYRQALDRQQELRDELLQRLDATPGLP